MKKVYRSMLTLTSMFALFITFSGLGTLCRTWLYQPKVPQQLRDMDN